MFSTRRRGDAGETKKNIKSVLCELGSVYLAEAGRGASRDRGELHGRNCARCAITPPSGSAGEYRRLEVSGLRPGVEGLVAERLRGVEVGAHSRAKNAKDAKKFGSAQECGETGISGCFRESDKFGSGHGHALRLQQEVMQVFVAAPTSQQTFDIAVHRFHDTHRHFGAAIVEDPIQMTH